MQFMFRTELTSTTIYACDLSVIHYFCLPHFVFKLQPPILGLFYPISYIEWFLGLPINKGVIICLNSFF